MNGRRDGFERLAGAAFFSPKDFMRHAVLILMLFAIAHICGLREYTAIISGTMASPTLGAETCTLLAIVYMVFYFSAVVLAPILMMAAALLYIWEKVRDSSRRRLPS